jgi:tyrosyl-tRNA synthetase
VRIADDKRIVTAQDLTADGVIKLSLGKKQHILIKPE